MKKNDETEVHAPGIEVPARDADVSVLVRFWDGAGFEIVGEWDDQGRAHIFLPAPSLGDRDLMSSLLAMVARLQGGSPELSHRVSRESHEPVVGRLVAQDNMSAVVIMLEDPVAGTIPTEAQLSIAAGVFRDVVDHCHEHGEVLDYEDVESVINNELGSPWNAHLIDPNTVVVMPYEDPPSLTYTPRQADTAEGAEG